MLGLRRKFIDGTLRVWEKVETADSSAYNPTHIQIQVDDALETLYEQLSAVRDNEDGTISGKNPLQPHGHIDNPKPRVPRPHGPIVNPKHRVPRTHGPAAPSTTQMPHRPPPSITLRPHGPRPKTPAVTTGKGDGGDDDAAQALLMALHWASAVMEARPDTFGPQRFHSEETHLL